MREGAGSIQTGRVPLTQFLATDDAVGFCRRQGTGHHDSTHSAQFQDDLPGNAADVERGNLRGLFAGSSVREVSVETLFFRGKPSENDFKLSAVQRDTAERFFAKRGG